MRHNPSGRLLHQVEIEFASHFNPNLVEALGNLFDVILYMFFKLSIFIYICIQYKGSQEPEGWWKEYWLRWRSTRPAL